MLARRQGGEDDLGQVLGPVGGDQQCLGLVSQGDVPGIGKDRQDALPDRRAPVLAGEDGIE